MFSVVYKDRKCCIIVADAECFCLYHRIRLTIQIKYWEILLFSSKSATVSLMFFFEYAYIDEGGIVVSFGDDS